MSLRFVVACYDGYFSCSCFVKPSISLHIFRPEGGGSEIAKLRAEVKLIIKELQVLPAAGPLRALHSLCTFTCSGHTIPEISQNIESQCQYNYIYHT